MKEQLRCYFSVKGLHLDLRPNFSFQFQREQKNVPGLILKALNTMAIDFRSTISLQQIMNLCMYFAKKIYSDPEP